MVLFFIYGPYKNMKESNIYKIDSHRVSQYENERIVDTVTVIETPKKGAKKVLVHSPKLMAIILVYRKDLKEIK